MQQQVLLKFSIVSLPPKKQHLNSVVEGDAIVHKPTFTVLRTILYLSNIELFLQYHQLQGIFRGPSRPLRAAALLRPQTIGGGIFIICCSANYEQTRSLGKNSLHSNRPK